MGEFAQRQKILCICDAGAVRSVTLAWVLRTMRHKYNADSIAVSIRLSDETLDVTYRWADKIFPVTEGLYDRVPIEYLDKTTVVPIGDDVWKQSLHPELVQWIVTYLEAHDHELGLQHT